MAKLNKFGTAAEQAAKTFEELGATVESVDFNPSDYEEVFWSFFDYFAIKAVASNTDDVVNNRDQLTDYFGDIVDYAATLPATRILEILGNIGYFFVNSVFESAFMYVLKHAIILIANN